MTNKKDKSIQLFSPYNEIRTQHGRYSYKMFRNTLTKDCNLSKTLLNNCNLQNSTFQQCDLSSSDIQGTEFYQCAFINVTFNGGDISSCIFRECIFDNCFFIATNIIDNCFFNCKILSCKVESSTINTNILDFCIFQSFEPKDSSLYTNDFLKCNFIKCKLFSSIYYSIFEKCTFIESEIDSYIFGFQYGLRKKDLQSMKIEHFGIADIGFTASINSLRTIYKERQMILEESILNMICTSSLGESIELLIDILFKSIKDGYIIKTEHIRFIRRIIDHVYQENKISMYYYYFIIEKMKEQNIGLYRKKLPINVFNELTILYQSLYAIRIEQENYYMELAYLMKENSGIFNEIKIEFVYKSCPKIRLFELLSNVGIPEYYPIYEGIGSFHEVYLIAQEVCNNFAAIITIIGGAVGAIKALKKLIKRKHNGKDKLQKEKFKESNEIFYEIQQNEKTKYESRQLIEKEVRLDNFNQEYVFYNTVETTIIHKKAIIQSYKKSNIKQINFK